MSKITLPIHPHFKFLCNQEQCGETTDICQKEFL